MLILSKFNILGITNYVLSSQQCRFRKGLSNQCCFIRLVEKWKKDQGLMAGVLLTDLTEMFDCLSLELLAGS